VYSRVYDRFIIGRAWLKYSYLSILVSHMILAIVVLADSCDDLSRAQQRFPEHRRIARWTYPIWMYVSITGVVVYVNALSPGRRARTLARCHDPRDARGPVALHVRPHARARRASAAFNSAAAISEHLERADAGRGCNRPHVRSRNVPLRCRHAGHLYLRDRAHDARTRVAQYQGAFFPTNPVRELLDQRHQLRDRDSELDANLSVTGAFEAGDQRCERQRTPPTSRST